MLPKRDLVVVIDIQTRLIIGWSMQSRQTIAEVLQALLTDERCRKRKNKVKIHSDQGSRSTSLNWA
jgi:putative transposase